MSSVDDGDGELPEGWRTVRLGDVVSVKGGKRLPAGTDYSETSTPHPYIRVVDFSNGSVRRDSLKYIDQKTHEAISRYTIRSTDVYISIAGSIGVVGRVPADLDGANLTENAAKLVPNGSLDSDYLWRALSSPELQSHIADSTIATTQPKLARFRIEELPLPLPPLPEQRRIVAKLEALQSRSRRAREALEAVPPLLEKLRQSILAAAFRGDLTADWREQHPDVEPASELLKRVRIERRKKWEQAELAKLKAKGKTPTADKWKQKYVEPEPVDDSELPDLPEGWGWARAQELATGDANAICAGPFGTIFKAKDFRPEGIPIVFLRHGSPGKYLTRKPGFMDRGKWKELFLPYSVYGGELLVTKLGDPPGACAIYPNDIGPAMVTPDVIKMEPDKRLALAEYLMHYFNSDFARQTTFGMSYGTTRLRMTIELFRDMPVPLTPAREQVALVGVVSEHFRRLSAIVDSNNTSTTELERLTSAILSKAFRGELVPQDPNDAIEPAPDAPTTKSVPAPTQTKGSRARTATNPKRKRQ